MEYVTDWVNTQRLCFHWMVNLRKIVDVLLELFCVGVDVRKVRIDSDDTYGSHVHHVFAGMNEEASEYKLEPREVFTTPKLALTYSCEGLGEASRNLHRWARMGMVYSCDKPRDILLNSWEGVLP